MTTTEPTAAGTAATWRRLGNIRVRVVVGYVALLAAALAVSTLVIRQVLLARLDDDIDRALALEVEELRLLAGGTDPATGEPFGTDARAILDTFLARNIPADNEAFYTLLDGAPYLRSFDAPPSLFDDEELVDEWAGADRALRGTDATAAGEIRYLAAPLLDGDETGATFVVVHFPGPDRAQIAELVRIVVVAGAVVLIASAALAWSLAGRVLRPVRDLTDTARSITETDLSTRIPVDGDDELADLGRTFNQMLDRLERGFEDQREFLDDVAHELRTPITIVQGHLELLSDDPVERADAVDVIHDELDRMSRYVSDLLLLAKAERPDFLEHHPIDLGEFAEDLMARVPGLGERSWVLDEAPPPGRTAIVADPSRLSQAVLNLAANAVQHTGPGDEIGLGVAVRPGPLEGAAPVARIWVRDTGPGVDPAVEASLFHRHTRAASSRAGRPDGLGIGLSIVDAIARAHGGSVDVDSTRGDGATFVVTVPTDSMHEHDGARPSTDASPDRAEPRIEETLP